MYPIPCKQIGPNHVGILKLILFLVVFALWVLVVVDCLGAIWLSNEQSAGSGDTNKMIFVLKF